MYVTVTCTPYKPRAYHENMDRIVGATSSGDEERQWCAAARVSGVTAARSRVTAPQVLILLSLRTRLIPYCHK